MFGLFGKDPAWKTPPAGPRRRVKDLSPITEHIHEVSGARLILARDRTDGAIILGWVAPWQKSFTAYHAPARMKDARKIYAAMAEWGPPVTKTLQRDWQRNLLYGWEDTAIDAASPDVTPDQMKNIVHRISRDFNLAADPSLSYKKPRKGKNPESYYYPRKNHIHMGHKQLSAVVHEMAHAIDEKIYGNEWSAHGPSYVRTLIMLAERYQYWLNPNDLEKSARDAGLMVAPRDMPQIGPAPKPS